MLKTTFLSPRTVLGVVTALSVISLGMALYAEVALQLEPCILCIYQRIPFLIVIVLGMIGLGMHHNKPRITTSATFLAGLTFLVNSAIAFYHTGIEQKWWTSAVEGCAVPQLGNDSQSMLENILSAPTGNCAEIPWADPVLGLSMANYNALMCLALAALCMTSFHLSAQKN